MPYTFLYCTILRLQLFGFQQLDPLPPFPVCIPMRNVILAYLKTFK